MLIESQKVAGNGTRYDILDLIQSWIMSLGGRASTKRARYTFLHSFFTHNRAELPRDPSFKIRSEIPASQGVLTVEEVKRVIESSKPAYQAVFLCMLQGGLGADQLLYWNEHGWDSLREQLAQDAQIIKIDLPGRKANKNLQPFYSFVGLEVREEQKRTRSMFEDMTEREKAAYVEYFWPSVVEQSKPIFHV